MSVAITGRHVAVTPALRRYVEGKVDRLDRFGLALRSVQVIITVEKFRHSAEVLCVLNRRQYRAKASSSEMYASIDLMMDKIERQIRKKKDKLVNHKGEGRRRPMPLEEGEQPTPRVAVTVLRPAVPTLTVDEALDVLQNGREPFMVFVDYASEEVNVLRRVDERRVELLVPRRRRLRASG